MNTDSSYSTTMRCPEPTTPAAISSTSSSDSPTPGTKAYLLGLLRICRRKSNHLGDNKVCSASENVDVSSNSTAPRRIRERRASLPRFTCQQDSTGNSSGSSGLGIKFLSPTRRLSFRRNETLGRRPVPSSEKDENPKEDASSPRELSSLSLDTPKLSSLPLLSMSALLHDCSVDDGLCKLPTALQQPLEQGHVPQRSSNSHLNVTSGSSCFSSSSSLTPSSSAKSIKPTSSSSNIVLRPCTAEMPPRPPLARPRSISDGEVRKFHSNNNSSQKRVGCVQFDLEPIIHFIDIAHDDDHDLLWWNRDDLQKRLVLERYMNAEPVATPNARDYYKASARIYHEVCCGGQIHRDVLAQLLPGLDTGLRGTEINCTDVGARRKERTREIVRSIVNAQRKSHSRPESLRFQSCRFTKSSRKIAQILAVADRMAVEMDF
jgi:hypothetical protein